MKEQNEPTPKQSLDNLSLSQKIAFVQWLSYFPAISIMVFLRKGIGFRMLKPYRIFIVGMIIGLGPLLALLGRSALQNAPMGLGGLINQQPMNPITGVFSFLLPVLYALAFVGVALLTRYRRWQDYLDGKYHNSMDEGKSIFEPLAKITDRVPFLQQPTMLALFSPTPRRVRRYFDPICVMIIALIMTGISPWLGFWLAISAMSLAIYEDALYEARLDAVFEVNDSHYAATAKDDVFAPMTAKAKPQPVRPRVVLPTGPAADTEKLRAGMK